MALGHSLAVIKHWTIAVACQLTAQVLIGATFSRMLHMPCSMDLISTLKPHSFLDVKPWNLSAGIWHTFRGPFPSLQCWWIPCAFCCADGSPCSLISFKIAAKAILETKVSSILAVWPTSIYSSLHKKN